jgi:hypothetical protein
VDERADRPPDAIAIRTLGTLRRVADPARTQGAAAV